MSRTKLTQLLATAILASFSGDFASSAQGQIEKGNAASPHHFEPEPNKPMQFRMAGTGGNCLSCTWIAAEGTITEGTAERFLKFLDRTQALGGMYVHLNSQGGSVLEALKLGEVIRKRRFNTVVSQTIGEENKSEDPKFDKYIREYPNFIDKTKPVCLSACAIVFAAGNSRYAEAMYREPQYLGFGVVGPVGVHQFYSTDSLGNPDAPSFSAIDRMIDQAVVSDISVYLEKMGIGSSFISLMAKTPPFEMHMLTEEELRSTGLVNYDIYSAALKAYRNGVAVVEVQYQKPTGGYRLELYCKDNKIRMLAHLDENSPTLWSDALEWRYYEEVILADTNVSVKLITKNNSASSEATIEQLLFEFDTRDLSQITNLKVVNFDQKPGAGNRYSAAALYSLSFKLPADFDGMYILPKTCQ